MTDLNGNALSTLVHLHDLNGDVIHVHAPGITLGMFFESLGMKLETKTDPKSKLQQYCFTDDQGNLYCGPRLGCYSISSNPLNVGEVCTSAPAPATPILEVYVNGTKLSEKPEDYVIQDLDQILISYHAYTGDISNQLAAVTDKACIQSGKCPERGEPAPEDSCGGTECGTGTIPTA